MPASGLTYKETLNVKTSLLSTPGSTGGLRCKQCDRPIRNLFQNELICFECWSARRLKQPDRHFHKIQPPKPMPGGMV